MYLIYTNLVVDVVDEDLLQEDAGLIRDVGGGDGRRWYHGSHISE
jgi:hypothetical protein